MTLAELYQWGSRTLAEHQVEEAALDARYLLEDVFSLTRNDYLLRQREEADQGRTEQYQQWIRKRGDRVPWQYITGHTEFMGLDFDVNENVLIPRQDTECLVEEVLAGCQGQSILDMCTGSGCIGISLYLLGNPAKVTAVDISKEALQVARINNDKLGANVSFVESDLFEQVEETYDWIVSNPPYISETEFVTLFPEVKDKEPTLALVADHDGYDFYERITKEAPNFLNEGGMLCFEIGCSQGERVMALMKQNGFDQVCVKKDLAGLDRMVFGRYKLVSERNGEHNV